MPNITDNGLEIRYQTDGSPGAITGAMASAGTISITESWLRGDEVGAWISIERGNIQPGVSLNISIDELLDISRMMHRRAIELRARYESGMAEG